MDNIENVIQSFGGHQYKVCYRDLCQAIAVEKEYQPDPPQMKAVIIEASRRAKKSSAKSMWRSVARAVEDLWDSGDRDELTAFQRCWRSYRPKPREFIEVVARRIWNEESRHG